MDPSSHVRFQISTGRGPSNEHLWQVWLKSVQRFQRRRVKCEKLTDGRLPMTKAHMAYVPGELKICRKTETKLILLTQIHDKPLSWLGTGTSIISGGVKLVLWAQSSPLSEMMTSYKCFLHAS